MGILQETFDRLLAEHADVLEDKGEEISEAHERILRAALPEIAKTVSKTFSKTAPETLRVCRQDEEEFYQNNYARWHTSFSLIELYLGLSTELGSAVSAEFRPAATKNQDYFFEAIITLHARALLVSREIFWLMKGGYADGALGRWRTLHEIAVVANFLSIQDPIISKRYLLHRTIESYKTLTVYAQYQDRANLTPLGEDELPAVQAAYDEILEEYGPEMRHDWGWATPAFDCKKTNFQQIEQYVDMDHWRPRYKWASQDTHGNYRPADRMLGTSEVQHVMLLVGPSNSGFADPGQMMIVSLSLINDLLIAFSPNIDRLIYSVILDGLIEQISKALVEESQLTEEQVRSRIENRDTE